MIPETAMLASWIAAQASRRPGAAALCTDDGVRSFAGMQQHAMALSGWFGRQGLMLGEPLAIAAGAGVIAEVLYAALWYGLPLIPLDPSMAPARLDRLLSQAGCRTLLTDDAGFSVPAGVRSLVLPETISGDPCPVCARLDGNAIRLIIATSGSSGEPKGVMLSDRNLAAAVLAARQRLQLDADDSWLCCLPLYHIGGLAVLLRCLEAGAQVILHTAFDTARVWEALQTGAVSHISLVPAMLARLLDHAAGRPPAARLRVVLVGGGALDPGLAQRARGAGWPLCVTYGMSETASQVATDCGAGAGLEPGLVGRPLPGFELRLSASGNGRIQLRGPALMAGYVNPGRMPGDGLQDGWFETSDLGRLDEQGRLWVMGRADDQLLSGGRTIHPQEVEQRLLQCPGVQEVAVTGCPDPVWGQRLVALVVGTVKPNELDRWARAHLPGPLRPRTFLRVDALPYGPTGKLQRKALQALLQE